MSNAPVIIVLAAGLGSRFSASRHKLAQPLGTNTVLGQTVGHAIASGFPVVVVATDVMRADAARMVAGRDVVLLPAARIGDRPFGMGHSIAAGVAARPEAAGWLVLPGDMPLVRPMTLVAVAEALALHPVAFAQHHGRRGHPVGFAAELFSDLVQLSGDEGARRIVARYPSFGVEVDDPGVLIDVDTQADLAAVQKGMANSLHRRVT